MHYYPIMAVTALNASDAYSQAQDKLNQLWESSGGTVYDFGDVLKRPHPVKDKKAIACIRKHIQLELNTLQEYWDQLRALRERMANPEPPAPHERFHVTYRMAHTIGAGLKSLMKSGTEISTTATFDHLLWVAQSMLKLSEHIQDKRRSEQFVYNASLYDRREDATQDILAITARNRVWLIQMDLHS